MPDPSINVFFPSLRHGRSMDARPAGSEANLLLSLLCRVGMTWQQKAGADPDLS